MSERSSKITRRDTRRLLGETTTKMLGEIVTAIKEGLLPAQHALGQRLSDHEKRIAALEARIEQPFDPASRDGHY